MRELRLLNFCRAKFVGLDANPQLCGDAGSTESRVGLALSCLTSVASSYADWWRFTIEPAIKIKFKAKAL